MSSVLDVKVVDGFYHVDMGDGLLLPIRNGRKMDEFSGGWSPVCASKEFFSVVVLLLRREDGALAPWYLDAELNRVGGTVAEIPPHLRTPLLEKAAEVFRTIVSFATSSEALRGAEAVADLAMFEERILGELADLAAQADPNVTTIKRLDASLDPVRDSVGTEVPHLHRAFEGKLQHDFLALVRNKELRRPSPISGSSCIARIGLILTPRLTAYQFVDDLTGAIFYVIPDHYFERVVAIYIPHLRVYAIEDGAPPFAELFWRLVTHVIAHHQAITRFTHTASTKRPVNFLSDYPWLHIGHVLWNELSGLEELTCLVENDLLPHVCVINSSAGSEVYGPTDRLFPEFGDRLVRWELPWRAVARTVYDSDFLYFRYMTKFVRSRVGARVLSLVKQDPRLLDDQQTARRLRDERRTGVCLGLRCGNRTMQDQTQVLIHAIEHLVDRLDHVTIVLDGMNSRINSDPSTCYGAFGPATDQDNVITELKTVLEIRNRFLQDPRVEIVSTIGRPISASLFWINECRFFVAPWGAALAKYRWICNKPGFVMTNRPILANPTGDITIYHHKDYMESPSRMVFIAMDKVSDAPGPGGFYANFVPDLDAVKAGIDSLIEEAGLLPSSSEPVASRTTMPA